MTKVGKFSRPFFSSLLLLCASKFVGPWLFSANIQLQFYGLVHTKPSLREPCQNRGAEAAFEVRQGRQSQNEGGVSQYQGEMTLFIAWQTKQNDSHTAGKYCSCKFLQTSLWFSLIGYTLRTSSSNRILTISTIIMPTLQIKFFLQWQPFSCVIRVEMKVPDCTTSSNHENHES